MPKVALITCNIGGIDSPGRPVKQTVPCDFYLYTEENLPVPLPNLSSRMVGKYLKMMTHRFLPDYDIYIWIDGNIEVKSEKFVENIIDKLDDVAISVHPDRQNVYEEIGHIEDNIRKQNKYLSVRYKDEPFGAELEFYGKECLPPTEPLYACRFFARKNTPDVNKAFEEWWIKTCEYTNFDQTMFTLIAWKYRLKVRKLNHNEYTKNYLEKHEHLVIK